MRVDNSSVDSHDIALRFVSKYANVSIQDLSINTDLREGIDWKKKFPGEDVDWILEDLVDIFIMENKITHLKRVPSWIKYAPPPISWFISKISYPLVNFDSLKVGDLQDMYDGKYWKDRIIY